MVKVGGWTDRKHGVNEWRWGSVLALGICGVENGGGQNANGHETQLATDAKGWRET